MLNNTNNTYKTIYRPGTAYGGYEYRVTGNGETVHIQQRKGGCISFKTQRTLTQSEWDNVYNQNFDAYNNNPAVLARLVEEGK